MPIDPRRQDPRPPPVDGSPEPMVPQSTVDSLIFEYEQKLDVLKGMLEEERNLRLVAEDRLKRASGQR